MAHETRLYSDSEEFLMGVQTGLEKYCDSTVNIADVQPSDNPKYEYMLVETDSETNGYTNKYYDGASLDYEENG